MDESILIRSARSPDRVLRYGPEPEQIVDIYLPAGSSGRPPVIFLHGGFWRQQYDRTHARPLAQALSDQGRIVQLVEYRRAPGQPDQTVADVQEALRCLTPGTLIGHSAGGHLALLAAATLMNSAAPSGTGALGIPGVLGAPGILGAPGVRGALGALGVLALAPVADLLLAEQLSLGAGAVTAFLGTTAAERADLDPTHSGALPSSRAVTIIHGALDDTVPPAVSRSYVAAVPYAELVIVPDSGHYSVIDPDSSAWPVVLKHLERLEGRLRSGSGEPVNCPPRGRTSGGCA